jgi:hypothetical protein
MFPAIQTCRYAEEREPFHAPSHFGADHNRGYDNDNGGVRRCRLQQLEIRLPDSRLIGVVVSAYEAAE